MIVVIWSYWQDYTTPKIKSMGGFSISILKWNEFFLPNLLIGARGAGNFSPGSSIAGNWSGYNLCDIVTKASVAFYVATDPDIHFKCCRSADSKVQASIKHETKGKPIQACRIHSGALDELTSQQSTGKCLLLLFFQIKAHVNSTF